jgi:hypothetical protein
VVLFSEDEKEKSQKKKKGNGSGPLHDGILDRVEDPGDQDHNQSRDHDTEKKAIFQGFHIFSGLAE